MPIIIPDPPAPKVPLETLLNRRNTRAFIAADPVTVTLRHYERSRQASGGRSETLVGVTPVTFRLVPQSDAPEQLRTTDGRLVLPKYVAVAPWDADLRRLDRFEWDEQEYQITAVHPPHGPWPYESKGDVVVFNG